MNAPSWMKDVGRYVAALIAGQAVINAAMALGLLPIVGMPLPFLSAGGSSLMTSFIGLAGSQGVPTLQTVAPGIAEALVATAIGLAAAIPAVIAYNYFISRVKRIDIDMENFSSEFLNIVDRYIKKV